jgi:hypothetical protein
LGPWLKLSDKSRLDGGGGESTFTTIKVNHFIIESQENPDFFSK